MYRYDTILKALKNNKSIKFITPNSSIPNCPMQSSPLCKKQMKNCANGNNGTCEQPLKIWYMAGKLCILYPRFVHPANSQNGFFLETDRNIDFLVKNNILKISDLIVF